MITQRNIKHFYHKFHRLPYWKHYKILSKYRGMNHRMLFFHTVCGHKIHMTPHSLLRGCHCHICTHEPLHPNGLPRLTNERFKKLFSKLPWSDEYKQLTKCHGYNHKIKILHKKCGHILHMIPDSLLHGAQCRFCMSKQTGEKLRMSNSQFIKRFHKCSWSNNYIQLTKCHGYNRPIKFYHKICNHTFYRTPEKMFHYYKCPCCARKRGTTLRMTNKEFQKLFKRIPHHSDYIQLTKCKGSKRKIKLLHKPCGHIIWMTPQHLLNGYMCKYCADKINAKKRTITPLQASERVIKATHGEYRLISEYKDYRKPLLFVHLTCKNTFIMTFPRFFSYTIHCPYCREKYLRNESKGEYTIEHCLKEHGLVKNRDYYHSYRLLTYKLFGSKRESLHADFYLPHIKYSSNYYNGVVIEFDGGQHFKLVPLFTDTNDLYWQLMEFACENSNDILKDYYCMVKHIKLIRVPNIHDYDGNRLSSLVSSVLNTKLFNKDIQLSLF